MIDLNGIELKNRFIIAAGPWSFYWKRWPFLNPGIFGAFTTNTFTLESREGNLEFFKISDRKIFPKIWKVLRKIPGGWINSSGWRNPGIDWAIEELYPKLKRAGANIIFSIGGFQVVDYLLLIEKLRSLDVLAIELNVSCPNVGFLLRDIEVLRTLFSEAKRLSNRPLIVKIGADSDYLAISEIAKKTGINALNAINTVKGQHSGLESGQGGIGGRIIKATSLRVIRELKFLNIPIIATGGVYSFEDVKEFLDSGADAVSFGSVFLSRPWVPQSILKKIQSGA